MDYIKLKRISEEECSRCGKVFNAKTILTRCNCRGRPYVVSCNACSMNNGCGNCNKGNKFEERS